MGNQNAIQNDLSAFIKEGHHKYPGPRRLGRLRTLHELNVAFARNAAGPIPSGAAAQALKTVSPELHAEMKALAPRGYLIPEVKA